jgi:hypothetical protein
MEGNWKRIKIGIALLLVFSASSAQTGGNYDLSWNSLNSGGRMFSTGGGYSLGGSIGQPAVNLPMNGGTYSLAGGFWAAPGGYSIYFPSMLNKN